MAGIGKAIKGLGLLAKKYKKAVTKKASSQIGWKKNLKERSRVFKEGQEKHKALDLKGKFKAIRKDKKPIKATWF